MLEYLQYVSIILELAIALILLFLSVKYKKHYLLFLFLTFAIYVFYDFSKMINLSINPDVLYLLFFIATLSAFMYVINLFKKTGKKKK